MPIFDPHRLHPSGTPRHLPYGKTPFGDTIPHFIKQKWGRSFKFTLDKIENLF
jgi:hypothetical protein